MRLFHPVSRSPVVLTLALLGLLAGSVLAFPTSSRRPSLSSSVSFSSLKDPFRSTTTTPRNVVMQAVGNEEMDDALLAQVSQQAHDTLDYLEGVAQALQAHNPSDPYLLTLNQATTAARGYLDYLARAQASHVAPTGVYEYLAYLEDCATSVEDYLGLLDDAPPSEQPASPYLAYMGHAQDEQEAQDGDYLDLLRRSQRSPKEGASFEDCQGTLVVCGDTVTLVALSATQFNGLTGVVLQPDDTASTGERWVVRLLEEERSVSLRPGNLKYFDPLSIPSDQSFVDPRPETLPSWVLPTTSSSAAVAASPVAAAPAVAAATPAGGDYLSALGGGAVKKALPRGKPKAAAGGTSYLDSMNNARGSTLPPAPKKQKTTIMNASNKAPSLFTTTFQRFASN